MKYLFLLVGFLFGACGQNVAGGATDTETGGALAGVLLDDQDRGTQARIYLTTCDVNGGIVDSTTTDAKGFFVLQGRHGAWHRILWKNDAETRVLRDSIWVDTAQAVPKMTLKLNQYKPYYAVGYQVWLESADLDMGMRAQTQLAVSQLFDSLNRSLNQSQNYMVWHHYPMEWRSANVLDSTLQQSVLDGSVTRVVFSRGRDSKQGNWISSTRTIWMQPYATEPGVLPVQGDYVGQFIYLAGLSRGALSWMKSGVAAKSNALDGTGFAPMASPMFDVNLRSWDSLSLKVMQWQGTTNLHLDSLRNFVIPSGIRVEVVDSNLQSIPFARLAWHRVDMDSAWVLATPTYRDTCSATGQKNYGDTLYFGVKSAIRAMNYRLSACTPAGKCHHVWAPIDVWIQGKPLVIQIP